MADDVWRSGAEPEDFISMLGLGIVNTGGINEVRAQYSGFFLAVALVCMASLPGLIAWQTSFVCLGAVFGGLLAGRLVSLVLNGGIAGFGSTILALYAIDAIGFALAVASFILEGASKA
jgi:hypothetical protein